MAALPGGQSIAVAFAGPLISAAGTMVALASADVGASGVRVTLSFDGIAQQPVTLAVPGCVVATTAAEPAPDVLLTQLSTAGPVVVDAPLTMGLTDSALPITAASRLLHLGGPATGADLTTTAVLLAGALAVVVGQAARRPRWAHVPRGVGIRASSEP